MHRWAAPSSPTARRASLMPRGQGRLAHEAVAPDPVEQLGLHHDPVAVRDEVREHVEHLRLDVHHRPAPTQLDTIGVELALREHQASRAHHSFRSGPVAPAARCVARGDALHRATRRRSNEQGEVRGLALASPRMAARSAPPVEVRLATPTSPVPLKKLRVRGRMPVLAVAGTTTELEPALAKRAPARAPGGRGGGGLRGRRHRDRRNRRGRPARARPRARHRRRRRPRPSSASGPTRCSRAPTSRAPRRAPSLRPPTRQPQRRAQSRLGRSRTGRLRPPRRRRPQRSAPSRARHRPRPTIRLPSIPS